MNDMQQRFQPELRLIISNAGGAAIAGGGLMPSSARSRPRLVDDDRPRRQLLQTMRLVGDARQAAANRLTSKNRTVQFTIAALLLICLGIWAFLLSEIEATSLGTVRRFALVAIACAATALLLLLAQLRDQRTWMRVQQLETCAAQIRQLRDAFALNLLSPGTSQVLDVPDARHAYREIVRRCPVDHSYSDYLKARLSPTSSREARVRAAFHQALDVYPISFAAWLPAIAVICFV